MKSRSGSSIRNKGTDADSPTADQLQSETVLKSDAFFRAITQNSTDVVVVVDKTGTISYANSALKRSLGYDLDEVIGIDAFYFIVPDERSRALRDFADSIMTKGELIPNAFHLQHKDGSKRLFEGIGTNLLSNPNVRGFVMNIRDVTDREKLREMEARTEKLASLELLIAGLAHELRNPLGIISSCVQLCLDTMKLSSRVKKNMEIIYRNSQRAAKLIHDLLNFARPFQLVLEEADINKILMRTLDQARLEKPDHASSVELDLDPELPSVTVDRGKMGQVFLNLILNAMDAVEENGRIAIRSHRYGRDSGSIEIEIADNGIGVPDDIRNRVFDPFFTTKEKGSGLGLSIAETIVRQHNGTIEFESESQGGTTVTVRLPSFPPSRE